MPIYKYVSPDSGLKYLDSWKLRCTKPGDLNDPFEISLRMRAEEGSAPPATGSKATELVRDAWADFKRVSADGLLDPLAALAADDLGILCLTRTPGHLLMWGHYAASHSGLLLEFDQTHACFRRDAGRHSFAAICGSLGDVVYSDRRPSIATLDLESVKRVAYTKSLEWAYEQEVRLLWPTLRADAYAGPDGKLALLEVPASALRSVTFGHYCSATTRLSAEGLLKQHAPHVKRYKAAPNRDEFRLDRVACD
jgi:hypothetical protein